MEGRCMLMKLQLSILQMAIDEYIAVISLDRATDALMLVLPQGEEYYVKIGGHRFQDVLEVAINGDDLFMKQVTVKLEKHVTSPDIEHCIPHDKYSRAGKK